MQQIDNLIKKARNCTICASSLPHAPRPVFRISPTARLLIIGQAPGTRVHDSGIPWDDPSGNRLRDWLGIDSDIFYDTSRIAIMPMGFCFPGQTDKGADLPPRKECAPAWHAQMVEQMPDIKLTLLIGAHAQKYYLTDNPYKTMTETVAHWMEFLPNHLPLPHPSWRNNVWIKKNTWFETDLLPALRKRVKEQVINK